MKKIDLRSDTMTQPSDEMRRAMATALVGDDVWGEDPTIIRLQEVAAELLGKEASLFVPSGTMANQISMRILCRPGDEVICETESHCYRAEATGGAVLSGLSFFPLPGERGIIQAEQVATAFQIDDVHYPISRLVALENTCNLGGGSVYPLETISQIASVARAQGLFLHSDGARMFNACQAGGYTPAKLASFFDTVGFCLSKGLGAPVGSMVVSSRELIKEGLRARKQFGGGMRQAGILAAAGLYALEHNLDRLAEDHARAKRLAEGLANMSGVDLDPAHVETNIIVLGVAPSGMSALEVEIALKEVGILSLAIGPTALRLVTYLQIGDSDIDPALKGLAKVLDRAG